MDGKNPLSCKAMYQMHILGQSAKPSLKLCFQLWNSVSSMKLKDTC
jgi:hypothetical protein